MDRQEVVATLDRAIVEGIVPKLYEVIDELLDHTQAPKDVVLRARKWLPSQYRNTLVKAKDRG